MKLWQKVDLFEQNRRLRIGDAGAQQKTELKLNCAAASPKPKRQ